MAAALAATVLLAGAGVPAGAGPPPTAVLHPGFGAPRSLGVGGHAVVAADFTSDGRMDLVSAASSLYTGKTVNLLVQTPGGTLAPPVWVPAHPGGGSFVSAVAADLDGDGDADLLVGTSNGIDYFEQRGGGLLAGRLISDLYAYELDVADLDGDGELDLVVDTVSTSGLRTMRGLGAGQFAPPVVVSTGDFPYRELEIGDVTGDGRVDIVGHHLTTVHVRAGLGDGTLAPPVEYPIPWPNDGGNGLAIGDFNGDGRLDVATTNSRNSPGSRVHVLYQTPEGALGNVVALASLDMADTLEAADMNLDGRTDLVTAHRGWSRAGIYLQQSDGTLAAEQLVYTTNHELLGPNGFDLGDFDGDGLPDIALNDAGGLTVVRSASQVHAWGLNNGGQLGDGGTADAHVAGPSVALAPVARAAAGAYHNLAVTYGGDVWAWGLNNAGQLGDGTTVDRPSPVRVNNLAGVTAVAGGTVHSVAIRNDGTLWAWGWNQFGQLGAGDNSVFRVTPAQVQGLSGVTAVAAGLGHTLAVVDGSVWAWGLGHAGQLGTGATTSSAIPVKVNGPTDVVAVAAGAFHSLAVTRDGEVWSWGLNDKGQLGIGSPALFELSPTLTSVERAMAIGAGAFHSVALTSAAVWAWGLNTEGELGDGTGVDKRSPTYVQVRAESIAVGWYHTVAVTKEGETLAWGWNHFGQLGTGTTANALRPITVPSTNTAAVGAGIAHTVAVTTRGG